MTPNRLGSLRERAPGRAGTRVRRACARGRRGRPRRCSARQDRSKPRRATRRHGQTEQTGHPARAQRTPRRGLACSDSAGAGNTLSCPPVRARRARRAGLRTRGTYKASCAPRRSCKRARASAPRGGAPLARARDPSPVFLSRAVWRSQRARRPGTRCIRRTSNRENLRPFNCIRQIER